MAMPLRSLLFWAALFGVAFGVVEAAVVVYLRAIAYPEGFAFPLKELPRSLLATETVREAATLALLLAFACAVERAGRRRFALFAFCFAVWDLAYYAALKGFLGWPENLLTWDVLFLIPVVWTGPVLAPILVSLALVGGAATLLLREDLAPAPGDWAVEVAAGALVLATFFWNSGRAVPESYPWWLFLLGWGGGVAWFVRVSKRSSRDRR